MIRHLHLIIHCNFKLQWETNILFLDFITRAAKIIVKFRNDHYSNLLENTASLEKYCSPQNFQNCFLCIEMIKILIHIYRYYSTFWTPIYTKHHRYWYEHISSQLSIFFSQNAVKLLHNCDFHITKDKLLILFIPRNN